MNDKNFSDKLEAFGTLGANAPAKTEVVNLPSISPQERKLAQAALQDYIKGNFAECTENFTKLELLRPKDLKLHLNKAIVNFCKSGFKDSEVFIGALMTIADQVKEEEQDVSSFIHYNLALGLFNTGQLSASLQHLLKAFQCIESLDEGLAQRVCILLIEVFLGLCQSQRALALLSYTENQLLSTFFSLTGQATDKSPVYSPGIIKHIKHKKELTTKLPAEPTTTPLPPAFETEWLKAKLAALRSRASLQARLWRTNKKDVKSLLAVTDPNFASTTLMAKTYLDFIRGQYNKSARVLNSVTPPETLESGDNTSLMWFNNLACSHFMGGRNLLAIRFISRAMGEAKKTNSCPAADTHSKIASAQLSMNMGIVLLHANQPAAAFEHLLNAVRVYSSNPRLWLRLAECCIQYKGQNNNDAYNFENAGKEVLRSVVPCSTGNKIILVNSLANKQRTEKTDSSSSSSPNLNLEFASLCLKNAMLLLSPNQSGVFTPGNQGKQSDRSDSPTSGQNQTVSGVSTLVETLSGPSTTPQCLPSIPLTDTEAEGLKLSVLAASAYTSLCLGDPLMAVEFAKSLLSLPNVPEGMKFLAQLYAAEGLIQQDKISEAIELLQPESVLSDLVWELPEAVELDKEQTSPEKRPKDRFEPASQQTARATMLYNLSVAYAIRGNLDKASETISMVWQCKNNNGKIPIHLVMLSIYVELQQGQVQNAQNLLNQYGIPQRA